MRNFTKIIFSLIICITLAGRVKGQTITLVPNVSISDSGFQSSPFIFGGNLYFRYKNDAGKNQVAKYDGTSISLIANPSDLDFGVLGGFTVYGSDLYFFYRNDQNNYFLAKLVGNNIVLINNPLSTGQGVYSASTPIVFGNNLYFGYSNASGNRQLAKYDGNSITLIINPTASDVGFNNGFVVLNGSLYFIYRASTTISPTTYFNYSLAKYDGNAVTLINNPSTADFGFTRGLFTFNNNIYGQYINASSKYQLAKYDGTSLSLINNISNLDFGVTVFSTAYNGNLYTDYTNSNGKSQLAMLAGNSFNLINNPSTLDAGIKMFSLSVVFNNNLYCQYKNSNNKIQLCSYNGNSISLISNPSSLDSGVINAATYNGNLYFSYYNSNNKNLLAKYDGNTISFLTNPDAGKGVNWVPIVYNNNAYFLYVNADGKNQLAYVSSVLPLNLHTFTAQQQNNTVNLSWQTTNEVNTSHFTIQRSVDGTSFSNIGKVVAKGDGSYGYTDNQPPSASVVYYRLQMVDKDGSFTYSKVVAVTLNVNRVSLAVYPNPVRDNLFVQITSTKAEKLTLQVTDLQGKLLQQEATQVGVGNVSLSVNTSTLAKGSYVLLVKGSGAVQQKQFVKE